MDAAPAREGVDGVPGATLLAVGGTSSEERGEGPAEGAGERGALPAEWRGEWGALPAEWRGKWGALPAELAPGRGVVAAGLPAAVEGWLLRPCRAL